MIKRSQNVFLFPSESLPKGTDLIDIMSAVKPLNAAEFLSEMQTFSFKNIRAVESTDGIFAVILKEFKTVPVSAITREVRKTVEKWKKENPDGKMSKQLKHDIKEQVTTQLYSQAPVLETYGWVYSGPKFTLISGFSEADSSSIYGALLAKGTTYHPQCIIDLPYIYGQEVALDINDMTNFLLWLWFVSETQRDAGHEFNYFQSGPVSIQLIDGVISDSTEELTSARYKLFKTEGALKKIEFMFSIGVDPVCGLTLSGVKEGIGIKYFQNVKSDERIEEFFMTIEAVMKLMNTLVLTFNLHYTTRWDEYTKLINEWLSLAAPACEREKK